MLDLAVAKKMLAHHGHDVGVEFDKRGKDKLDASLSGCARASTYSPWLILRDLDSAACPPSLLNEIAADRDQYPNMILRICVRSIEAWLIADQHAFAGFLGLRLAALPRDPDMLPDPKLSLVNIASTSRRRDLREGLVPREGSGRSIGPEYNAIMMSFVETHWSLDRALLSSESLQRAHHAISQFAD